MTHELKTLTPNELYARLAETGEKLENHASDLHVPMTDVTRRIVEQYEFKRNVTTFRFEGRMWYDIPFAYIPWWDARAPKPAAEPVPPSEEALMTRRFRITFHGRKNGAIGVCYKITETVEAVDAEAAVRALYDRYEHIHVDTTEEVGAQDAGG